MRNLPMWLEDKRLKGETSSLAYKLAEAKTGRINFHFSSAWANDGKET
jgi:hypothetical protein